MKNFINKNYKDTWVYTMFMGTLLVFIESLSSYQFMINDVELSIKIILVPLLFFMLTLIVKKHGIIESFKSVISVSLFLLLFNIFMTFIIGTNFDISLIAPQLFGYFISFIIFILIYNYLIKNTKQSYFLVLFSYFLGFVIYHLIFISLSISYLGFNFINLYLITLAVQMFIAVFLVASNKYIK